MAEVEYDVIIVGGGAAGMSAALVLGRSRRKVLVIDAGSHRNRFAEHVHGYLTRDGITPEELYKISREELRPYGVRYRRATVTRVDRSKKGFVIGIGRSIVLSRALLLATGVSDVLPPIPGIEGYYGKSIHHCPYCDGWEWRNKPIAVYGKGKGGVALSLKLLNWTPTVTLLTDGRNTLSEQERAELRSAGVALRFERISRLSGANGKLRSVLFADGSQLKARAMFFSTSQRTNCEFASELGCTVTSKGVVKTNRLQGTEIPGLYVAGDAARDMQFVVVAAAEGAKAAVAINEALMIEDRKSGSSRRR